MSQSSNLPLSPNGRRYGAHRSPFDHRDFGMARFPMGVAPLPSSVDQEAFCGPKRDQGAEGSCTAHAGVGMLEFVLGKHDPDFSSLPEFVPDLSPAYLYYKERLIDGTLGQGDCGSYGRTACKAMQQFGVCMESTMPYVAGLLNTPPSQAQDTEAGQFKSGAYHSLSNIQDMKACLVSDYVFIIGFTVYESFETKTGGTHVFNPKTSESILGGHETLVIGYDDSKFGGSFKVRNSWGANWGDKGNFWIPYPVMTNREVVMDAYIQHLGKPW